MAIEGNDWWAIAGAAAGGLVVGAVGAKLIKRSEPIFMGIRRWYEIPSAEDVRSRTLATVWQKNDEYWLKVYVWQMPTGTYLRDEVHFFNIIGQGAPYDIEEGPFDSVEEAMDKADSVLKETMDMEPITSWGYPSEKTALKV